MAESNNNNWEITNIISMTAIDENGVEHTTPWEIVYAYNGNVYLTKEECDEAVRRDKRTIVDILKCQKQTEETMKEIYEMAGETYDGELYDRSCRLSGEEKMSYCINKYTNKNRYNKRHRRQYSGK